MNRVWAVLSWSPIAKLPWHAKLFNMLWCWTLVLILFGWCDDTVVFDKQITEDDMPGYVQDPPVDWNTPLYLGDGRCITVDTRQYIEC